MENFKECPVGVEEVEGSDYFDDARWEDIVELSNNKKDASKFPFGKEDGKAPYTPFKINEKSQ